jgi:hypothetical protein
MSKLKLSTIIENIDLFESKVKSNDNLYKKYIRYINIIKLNNFDQILLNNFINQLFNDFNEISNIFVYSELDIKLITDSINENKDKLVNNLIILLLNQNYESKVKLKFYFSEEILDSKTRKYKVNNIECCSVKIYKESFCSIKNGRRSNTRDVIKTAKSTTWNKYGLEQIFGEDTFDRNYFKNSYPDTKWGNTGVAISFKLFKEMITDFVK